ncbi:MAG: hypothetical protein AYK19_19200 [Theionarchaea archaeon DG-70-1]|nr:MAG: hypothetical protein AYK19_19200 [Theionarchaea archaeon DG-70-1]
MRHYQKGIIFLILMHKSYKFSSGEQHMCSDVRAWVSYVDVMRKIGGFLKFLWVENQEAGHVAQPFPYTQKGECS